MAEREPTLDYERVGDVVAGDEGFLRELAATFAEDSATRIDELERALQLGELERASRLAHAVKGACLSLGAIRMGAIARALEDSTDLVDARGQLAALREELPRVCAALADWRPR